MIKAKPVTAYQLFCDRCGHRFETFDCDTWLDDDGMLCDAEYEEWLITDEGFHYCPNCYDYDEETNVCTPKEWKDQ